MDPATDVGTVINERSARLFEERVNDARVQIGAVVQIHTPGCAVMGLITAITAPMPAMCACWAAACRTAPGA